MEILQIDLFDRIIQKTGGFLNRSFPAHFHHEWSLALVETGTELVTIAGQDFHLSSGGLILIPPNFLHSNRGKPDAYWEYRCLYINHEALSFICRKSGLPDSVLDQLQYHVTYEPELVLAFKGILDLSLPRAVLESRIINLFILIVAGFSGIDHAMKSDLIHSAHLTEIMTFLHSSFHEKTSLDKLSSLFLQDKFKLLRSFRSRFGLTPQAYVTTLRIEHSKKLLIQRESIAEVALECGFFDQSHFTGTFLKYVGITPGRYKKSCNILQDSHI